MSIRVSVRSWRLSVRTGRVRSEPETIHAYACAYGSEGTGVCVCMACVYLEAEIIHARDPCLFVLEDIQTAF